VPSAPQTGCDGAKTTDAPPRYQFVNAIAVDIAFGKSRGGKSGMVIDQQRCRPNRANPERQRKTAYCV